VLFPDSRPFLDVPRSQRRSPAVAAETFVCHFRAVIPGGPEAFTLLLQLFNALVRSDKLFPVSRSLCVGEPFQLFFKLVLGT
jgi:hypothetical protein